MEIIVNENTICTYQRQGNDKNGNPIYLVNIFQKMTFGNWQNVNYWRCKDKKLDKYNNIRLQSYNIEADCKNLIESMEE